MTDPGSMTPADVATMTANVTGARLAQRYALAAIILALSKKGALDLGDLYGFLNTLSSSFAQVGATGAANAVPAAIAAEELAEIEPTIRNMLTVPEGAGRA